MRSYSNNFMVQVYFLFFKEEENQKNKNKKCEIKSKETTNSKKKN